VSATFGVDLGKAREAFMLMKTSSVNDEIMARWLCVANKLDRSGETKERQRRATNPSKRQQSEHDTLHWSDW
jgi:hypothetical protein